MVLVLFQCENQEIWTVKSLMRSFSRVPQPDEVRPSLALFFLITWPNSGRTLRLVNGVVSAYMYMVNS